MPKGSIAPPAGSPTLALPLPPKLNIQKINNIILYNASILIKRHINIFICVSGIRCLLPGESIQNRRKLFIIDRDIIHLIFSLRTL
ncbi:hypothetical protein SDC9_203478 [bioreactor metagenome]|uniref:Uncharacterized protein n=1 Tax=bioreactor metagenome TaxID=1076179 RepID=A0A645J5P1_9ZZZZ